MMPQVFVNAIGGFEDKIESMKELGLWLVEIKGAILSTLVRSG